MHPLLAFGCGVVDFSRSAPTFVMSASGTKRQFARCKAMSGVGGKADLPVQRPDFSVLTQRRHQPALHVAVAKLVFNPIKAFV